MCACVCVCVCALKTVCGVFFRKDTKVLGTFWKKGVPIEVVPMAYRPIQNKIVKELGGKCELRMANRKAVRKYMIYGAPPRKGPECLQRHKNMLISSHALTHTLINVFYVVVFCF